MAEVGGNETWICAKTAIGTERSRLCSRMAVPPESRRSGSLARCDYGVSGLAQMAQYEQRGFLATGLSERLSQTLMAHTGRKSLRRLTVLSYVDACMKTKVEYEWTRQLVQNALTRATDTTGEGNRRLA